MSLSHELRYFCALTHSLVTCVQNLILSVGLYNGLTRVARVKYSYYVALACVRFRRYFPRPKIFTGQNSSADNGLRYKFIGKVKPHGIEKRKNPQKCDINDLEYERIM